MGRRPQPREHPGNATEWIIRLSHEVGWLCAAVARGEAGGTIVAATRLMGTVALLLDLNHAAEKRLIQESLRDTGGTAEEGDY